MRIKGQSFFTKGVWCWRCLVPSTDHVAMKQLRNRSKHGKIYSHHHFQSSGRALVAASPCHCFALPLLSASVLILADYSWVAAVGIPISGNLSSPNISVRAWVSGWVSKCVSEWASEWVSEWVSVWVSEWVNEWHKWDVLKGELSWSMLMWMPYQREHHEGGSSLTDTLHRELCEGPDSCGYNLEQRAYVNEATCNS